jgi:multidrug efflux pump subunit AcrA (membrane-fusion protein)
VVKFGTRRKGVKMKKIGILILVLAVSLLGCGKKKEEETGKVVIPVKTVELRKGNIKQVLSFSGNLKAEEEVNVYSKVSGKLAENRVEVGDKVKKGETIAIVDRDETGFKFEPAPVSSPLKGTVGKIYLDKGASVLPNIPLALIINMDRVKVKIDISERYLLLISKGQIAEVRVDAYPEELFSGKVSRVSPLVNPGSRTAPVEISMANPGHRLKSGMFARVNIAVKEHKDVLTLPRRAILEKGEKKMVFVVEGALARKREVQTGIIRKERVEITGGLKEGERIVIEGNYGLKDGMSVKKQESEE